VAKKKLLFLTSRFPYPLEKGDKLRAYHIIRQLSEHFDIYLFALNQTNPDRTQIAALQPFCKAIETGIISRKASVLSMLKNHGIPFQVAYFYRKEIAEQIHRFSEKHTTEAVFCHLIRMSEYARSFKTQYKLLDYMDAFSKGMERIHQQGNWYLRLPALIEWKRLKKYEAEIFREFQFHTIISEQDKTHLHFEGSGKIRVVPNGVDMDFFHPTATLKKFDVLFNGHMSYPPNIASASYTAEKILPALRNFMPQANLLIAGAEPVRSIRALESSTIAVSGWMDDIREAFAQSRVMVAPMLISIGLQNKILQAMAMKIPCVISPMANNALGAVHGEHLFVAETPEQYATYISQLIKDEALCNKITESAYAFVRQHFSWSGALRPVIDALQV
jgi:sugar transferase (PEP-CTERM/EpsH1 system associated)